jgi:hypothetical protein
MIASGEIQNTALFLNHAANLTLSEERYEESDKTIIVRYVPLGKFLFSRGLSCLEISVDRYTSQVLLVPSALGTVSLGFQTQARNASLILYFSDSAFIIV